MSAESVSASREAQRAFVLYLPALLLMAGASYLGTIMVDGDTYFHVAAGQWILSHLQFIHRDFFTYTVAGSKWDDPEWLSEVAMAAAYRLAGWSGVALLYASAAALAGLILSRQLQKYLSPLQAIIVVQIALAIIASTLSSRPYLLAIPLLAAWTDGLLAARDRNTLPSLWLLPLMTVWSNLHGSFLFGIVLIGPFAAEAFFAAAENERLRVARSWTAFGAAALVAALINPNGIFGLIDPVLFMSKPILAAIGDWQTSVFAQFGALEFALLALLALSFTRSVRLPFFRLLLLLLLVHMTLAHRRHVNVFAIVAPMLLAEPIALAFGRNKAGAIARVPLVANVASGVAAAAAIAIAMVRIAIPNAIAEDSISPQKAIAHLPAQLASKHVFNGDSVGGFLIWHGIHPFIDTRVELYSDEFLDNYNKLFVPDRKRILATFKKYDVAWTLLQTKSPANSVIDQLPGWRILYADKFAVIHVRKDALGPASNLAQADVARERPLNADAR